MPHHFYYIKKTIGLCCKSDLKKNCPLYCSFRTESIMHEFLFNLTFFFKFLKIEDKNKLFLANYICVLYFVFNVEFPKIKIVTLHSNDIWWSYMSIHKTFFSLCNAFITIGHWTATSAKNCDKFRDFHFHFSNEILSWWSMNSNWMSAQVLHRRVYLVCYCWIWI